MPSITFMIRNVLVHPPVPTASFQDKTVIVTGGNTGLGLEAARRLIQLGAAKVILACRSLDKGAAAALDIQTTTQCSPQRVEAWKLDMSSYASVQEFASRASTELPRLDALIANAGVARLQFAVTEDNEETITTNVVSTALLGFMLHPKLRETAAKFGTQTHFTIVGSELYADAKFKESKVPAGEIFATLNDEKKSVMADRYNVSKLLNYFIANQMALLSPLESSGVVVNCVAPGFCKSGLMGDYPKILVRLMHLLARPTEVGSRNLVLGASGQSETHGRYVSDAKVENTMRALAGGVQGQDLQKRVWGELKEKLEVIRPGVTNLS